MSKGFTLLEMLIIVLIILLMLALLTPAFMRAQDHASKTRCANNMKQLWAALDMYYAINECHYPPAIAHGFGGVPLPCWGPYLYPTYIDDKNVFDCQAVPSVRKSATVWSGTPAWPDYTYNPPGRTSSSEFVVLSDTNHPTGEIVLYKGGKVRVR